VKIVGVLDKYSLAGRVAVVTGASRGLGKGYAVGLADAGATVICCSNEDVKPTADAINASGGTSEPIVMDVARIEETGKIFESIRDKYGSLDILINNAGVEDINKFVDVTPEQYDKIMGVNLTEKRKDPQHRFSRQCHRSC
jgi:NAD(P)-dependent dehydrogenase (short-subunit alcohol dehydrogenase family)